MGGIGIVYNPLSRRNRRDPSLAGRLRALLGEDGEVADASTPEELRAAAERLRAARPDLLGVCGGDGTAHQVVTAVSRALGDAPLPPLLLLPGGAMNTVARGHGLRGGPERNLRAVLARLRQGLPLRTIPRDLLAVSADGGEPRLGFLFGTGLLVSFLEAYQAGGLPSPVRAALLLARAAASAVVGGPLARSFARRERLRVSTDGDEWTDGSYLAVAAGSAPDVGLGFRAFARCAEQPGFFHAVGVTGELRQLALALPRIRRGAPWRRGVAQDEIARELVVEGGPVRFALDGDLHLAERVVRVATGPGVEIVLP